MTDYYTRTGCPPGFWIGTGTAGLGDGDRRVEAGATVTEEQLRRLLGDGRRGRRGRDRPQPARPR
ncbi:MAG: relaxase domain-containing protein [Streptosporangiaceae bacterium]